MTPNPETMSPLSQPSASISGSPVSVTAVALASDHIHRVDAGTLDLQDFDEIFLRHRDMVYRVCLRWLGHHHDAEDVAQETFRRAASAIQNWDKRRPIEPWLVTIAGNRCRSFLARRRQEKVTASFDGFAAEYSATPVEDRATSEEELISDEWLDTALNRLPADQRRAFELIHRDEFSYPQAAREMGRSVGTIKTWVHRARNTMQEIFRRESVRHTVAASVASIILIAGWFLSRPSDTSPHRAPALVAVIGDTQKPAGVESIRSASETTANDWRLVSLQAFTEADLRFDRMEAMPQGTIPVAHWIERTAPVVEQFQQGVAPMRRTIRNVMMLFSFRYEQGVAANSDTELSEVILSPQGSLELS